MRRLSIIYLHTQGSDYPLFGSTCRAPFATYIKFWAAFLKTTGKNDVLSLTISFFKTENETTSVRLVVLIRKRNERRRFNLSFSKNETKRQQNWRYMNFF